MAQLELVRRAPVIEAPAGPPRADHFAISQMVRDGARVLDIGCGDGALIEVLNRECGARARGLEIDQRKVNACVARGLSVVQGDAERDLAEYPSGSFDYVIFSHALQCLQRPLAALKEAARVGDRVIVSVRNAGHWRPRLRMALSGRLAQWDADILHPCSVRDFGLMARDMRLTTERAFPISGDHQGAPFAKTLWRANWFAEQAVFLLAP
ncbi:MAG: methionine biosynthesis protein MetW [Hyphomonadaceae bacterium]